MGRQQCVRGCRELGERRREGWRERGPEEGSRGSRVLGVVRPVLGSRGGSTAEPAACDPGENECGVSPFQNPSSLPLPLFGLCKFIGNLPQAGTPPPGATSHQKPVSAERVLQAPSAAGEQVRATGQLPCFKPPFSSCEIWAL